MKFLVTGINGFVGSNLARELLKRGHAVRGLILPGTDERFIQDLSIEKRYGDLTKPETLNQVADGIDVIIHLAAKVSDWGPKEAFRKINFEATRTLLDIAVNQGVKRFVFMSSLTVHGFKNFDNADEDTPYEPCNYYSLFKKHSEDLLNDYFRQGKIEIVIVRPGFVIFGPNDLMFSGRAYEQLTKGSLYPLVRKGKRLTCYSYVENLVDGLILVSEHPKAAGNAYILSDGPIIPWKEYYEEFFRPLAKKIKYLSIPYSLAYAVIGIVQGLYKLFRRKNPPLFTLYRVKTQVHDLAFTNEKARRELGFSPKNTIQEGVERTYQWFQQLKGEKNKDETT